MEFRLFVIDSSPAIRRLVEEAASTEGFEVTAFSDGPSALDDASRLRPQMIIADYHLEGLTFTTFCDKLNHLDLVPASLLIVLMDSSDRCDENALRARGVTAFVHKPVQVEALRQMIKELNEGRLAGSKEKPSPPRKTWPPESVTMGDDAPSVVEEDDGPDIREPARRPAPIPQHTKEDLRPASAAIASAAAARNNRMKSSVSQVQVPTPPDPARAGEGSGPERKTAPSPTPATPAAPRQETPAVAAAARLPVASPAIPPEPPAEHVPTAKAPDPPRGPGPQPHAGDPVMPPVKTGLANGLPSPLEESMRTFLSALLQSLTEGSQGQIAQLVSTLVAQHVNTELTRRIRDEVSAQVVTALPREDLTRSAQEAAEQKLPTLVAAHLGSLEHALRQDFTDKASRMVEELTAKLVRDLAEPAVQKHLPEIVHQQMGSVNGLVKEAAKEAATDYARDAAERIVRQVADAQVGQLVTTAVADVAEAQVKKELERLTAD